MKRAFYWSWQVLAVLVATILLVVACGGGGGGSERVITGREAAIRSTLSAYIMDSLTGVSFAPDDGEYSPQLADLGKIAWRATRTRQAGWVYDPFLGVYFNTIQVSETHFRTRYAKNPDGTGLYGTIDTHLVDPEPYPISTKLVCDLRVSGVRYRGTVTLTAFEESGDPTRLAGDIQLSKPELTSEFDLLSGSEAISGDFRCNIKGAHFVAADLDIDRDNVRYEFTINGISGQTVKNADGSGRVTVNATDGPYILSWDTEREYSLKHPDSTVEALPNLWEIQ